MALQRLKEAAERAKIELSGAQSTDINLPYITADASGPKHLQLSLNRSKFEQLCDSLFERLKGPCLTALKEAKIDKSKIDEVLLVGGSTRIPKVQQICRELFGREPNRSVNPDEVVAMGAAVQAGIATGSVKDILVLDATPLSLGVEVMHGVMNVLIPKNTTIPTQKKEVYSTATDNQPAVTIKVYQGERPVAAQNRLLGQFDLTDIPPAPRGMPQIEITFDIDANGILKVSAKDKGTNRENKIEIKSDSGLNAEEIERMKRDAEAHADEDKKKLELIEAKNEADKILYGIEKTLREHGDKVTADEKTNIENAKKALEDVMKGDDVAAIKAKTEELTKASYSVAEKLYKASQAQPGPNPAEARAAAGNAGAKQGDGPEVVDAEYEVKDGPSKN